jgi:hypothetical protein
MRRMRRITIVALLGAITFTTPAFAKPSDAGNTAAASHGPVVRHHTYHQYLGGADIINPTTSHRYYRGADVIKPAPGGTQAPGFTSKPKPLPGPPTWPTHYTQVHSTQPAATDDGGDVLPELPIGIAAVLIAAAATVAGTRVVSHRRHARIGA